MSWFYEAMREYEIEIECETDTSAEMLDKHINEHFFRYTVWKMMGHSYNHKDYYELYENIWEYLRDVLINYSKIEKNGIKLITEEDEEDDEWDSPKK